MYDKCCMYNNINNYVMYRLSREDLPIAIAFYYYFFGQGEGEKYM